MLWLKIIGTLGLIAAIVGGMIYLVNLGKENAELKGKVARQEDRYESLVERARQVQDELEEQQRLTIKWKTDYDALATKGPEIRERTRTVTEQIPVYLPPNVQDQRAEEALWGLAQAVTYTGQQLLEGGGP
jgi:hypothetical protein